MSTAGRLVVAVLGCALAAGCAGGPTAAPPTSAQPAASSTSQEPEMPLVHRVGPEAAGASVTLRVGDQLTVAPNPPGCERSWRLVDYPRGILRALTSEPAPQHTFHALSVGEGSVTLVTAADTPGCPPGAQFTVQIRVQTDRVRGGPGTP